MNLYIYVAAFCTCIYGSSENTVKQFYSEVLAEVLSKVTIEVTLANR